MPLAIPLIIAGLGLLASVLLPSCKKVDEVKEKVLPQDCENIQKPDSYQQVDDASYRVLYTLWLKDMGKSNPDPWLAKWLASREATEVKALSSLGAADYEFKPMCDGKKFRPDDKAAIAKWHEASTSFFRTYFDKGHNSSDDGILVLLAGLAPAEAGSLIVMGAMNAVNFPTEPPSHLRDQKTEFTQLIKAAYYFNVAADLADPESRYSVTRKRGAVKSRDTVTVKQNLKAMKDIMDRIKPEFLSERQRPIYDTLKKAADNLRAAM